MLISESTRGTSLKSRHDWLHGSQVLEASQNHNGRRASRSGGNKLPQIRSIYQRETRQLSAKLFVQPSSTMHCTCSIPITPAHSPASFTPATLPTTRPTSAPSSCLVSLCPSRAIPDQRSSNRAASAWDNPCLRCPSLWRIRARNRSDSLDRANAG